MKKVRKLITSLIISVALALTDFAGFLPERTVSAYGAHDMILVAGTLVQNDTKNVSGPGIKSGKVTYSKKDRMLTLDNATIEGGSVISIIEILDSYNDFILYIKLIGDNTLRYNGESFMKGIYSRNVNIEIDGEPGSTLNIESTDRKIIISDYGSITIKNADVTLTKAENDIRSCTAIEGDGVEISDSNIRVTEDDVYYGLVVSDEALSIKNSYFSGFSMLDGISAAGDIRIENSEIDVRASEKATYSLGNISIYDSIVNSKSTNNYGILSEKAVTVGGDSVVTAQGEEAAIGAKDEIFCEDGLDILEPSKYEIIEYNGDYHIKAPFDTSDASVEQVAKSVIISKNCTISYDPNGGKGTINPLTAMIGIPICINENTFVREGYDFVGFNTAEDGSGDAYGSQDTATFWGDTTLYAQWEPTQYKVSHSDTEGKGTISFSASSATMGTDVTMKVEAAEGYIFKNWEVVSGGINIKDPNSPETSFTMGTADVEVKAIFDEKVKVESAGYTGIYDGKAHGINVSVTKPDTGYEIKYGTAEGVYDKNSLEYKDAGEYTVYYKVSADGYLDVTGSEVIKIDRADVTVKADDKSKSFCDEDPSLTAEITGLQESDSENVLKYSLNREKGNGIGKYIITPSGESVQGNYNVSYETGTFTISIKSVTEPDIILNGNDFVYNGKPHVPEVTVKDGNTVIPESEYDVSYSDNVNAGTATVTVTDRAGGNYEVNGSKTFTIKKADMTITADDHTTQVGERIQFLSWTISGAVEGDYIDLITHTEADRGAPAGKYVIDVTVRGEYPNYNITLVNGTYTITKLPIDATATGYSGTYDKQPHSISVEVGAPDAVIYYSTEKELTEENYKTDGSTDNPSRTDGGITTVYYYIESANYEPSTISGSKDIVIYKAPLTIKAQDNTITYGDEPSGAGVEYSGFVDDDNEEVLEGTLSYSFNYSKMDNIGVYDIIPGGLSSDSYEIEILPGRLVVEKALNNSVKLSMPYWVEGKEPSKPTIEAAFGSDKVYLLYGTEQDGEFTPDIPTKEGHYYVKAVIDDTDNYVGAVSEVVGFDIVKIIYSRIDKDQELKISADDRLEFTLSRNYDDKETYKHFVGLKFDDEMMSDNCYDTEAGSIKIMIHAGVFSNASVGEHTIIALFDDGLAEPIKFTIIPEEQKEETTKDPSESAEAPAESTQAPDETSAPSESTQAPDETSAPSESTQVPDETSAPSETSTTTSSSAADSTTKASVNSSGRVVKTGEAVSTLAIIGGIMTLIFFAAVLLLQKKDKEKEN